ncbi:MAG: hypothetical protein WA820_26820, partial [Bradyrhizobium sp.]
ERIPQGQGLTFKSATIGSKRTVGIEGGGSFLASARSKADTTEDGSDVCFRGDTVARVFWG